MLKYTIALLCTLTALTASASTLKVEILVDPSRDGFPLIVNYSGSVVLSEFSSVETAQTSETNYHLENSVLKGTFDRILFEPEYTVFRFDFLDYYFGGHHTSESGSTFLSEHFFNSFISATGSTSGFAVDTEKQALLVFAPTPSFATNQVTWDASVVVTDSYIRPEHGFTPGNTTIFEVHNPNFEHVLTIEWSVKAVPEPSTYAGVLATGLLLVMGYRAKLGRRRAV